MPESVGDTPGVSVRRQAWAFRRKALAELHGLAAAFESCADEGNWEAASKAFQAVHVALADLEEAGAARVAEGDSAENVLATHLMLENEKVLWVMTYPDIFLVRGGGIAGARSTHIRSERLRDYLLRRLRGTDGKPFPDEAALVSHIKQVRQDLRKAGWVFQAEPSWTKDRGLEE
jgi:hypothetical protein